MLSPARLTAFRVLRRITLEGAYSDYALHSPSLDALDLRDRRLATDMVYGTLRWQGLLDCLLARFCHRPMHELDDEVRILLRLSLYQLRFMDRIPPRALVHDAVEISKRFISRSSAGFVNGVLRNLGRNISTTRSAEREMSPWDAVSLPRWLWERWKDRYGEERTREFALSLNVPPRTCYRTSGGESAGPLPEWELSDLVPGALFRVRDAGSGISESLRIQDEASQLVPQILGPSLSGLRVWDACAAPGGKSSILFELMGGAGTLVCTDVSPTRATRLYSSFIRNKLNKVHVIVSDSRMPPLLEPFDVVTADVPCSGLGTLRRNPEIKWRIDVGDLQRFATLQLEILEAVAGMVRPGGLLQYSTCSTEPEENEQVVEALLERESDFGLVRPVHPPGIDAWIDGRGYLRTFPSTRRWDGFFSAIMVRNA